MQQQHNVRSSVASLMSRHSSSAEAALILGGTPQGLAGAFAMLPARKGPRR